MKYDLLSVDQDAKTSKGVKFGYWTGILYLAPAKEADGVHDLCPMRSDQCTKACLYGAGMAGVFPSIKEARIERTLEYLADFEGFVKRLAKDIVKLQKEAKSLGLKPCVRLNGTSDQPKLAHRLCEMFPSVQFYDYTKIPRPWQRLLPNYHLTFSFSGENFSDAQMALMNGVNVAVVFSGKLLPETWRFTPVVDGDVSDLRFLDKKGVIVGLRAKGTARKMETGGFIQIGRVA